MERKRKAPVWRYYEDINNSNSRARCLLCDFSVRHHGNTTNLLRHLKARHSDEIDLSPSIIDPASTSSPTVRKHDDAKQKSSGRADNKTLLDQFMAMVATDLQPETSSLGLEDNIRNRKRSPIWQYYEPKPGTGNKEAVCTLCMDTLRYHGNSTNLLKHLRAKHSAEAEAASTKIRTNSFSFPTSSSNVSIASAVSKLGKSVETSKLPIPSTTRSKLFDQKVMSMIINDLHPVSVVESNGFIDLIRMAEPRYIIPNRKTITTQLLPNLYKEVVDRVFKRLEDIEHIALTTELWSPRHHESYLGVTAHFISPIEWTLQTILLSTTVFYGNPSGRHITSELERTVNEWNIARKVRVMVTDQETNALLANEQLPWAYIPCLAHLIHFVVTDALNGDDRAIDLIDKVSGIVRYFKEDTEKREKLRELQMSLDLPQHKLILCVPTRWNSTYLMLERMYEQMDAVNAVLQAYDKLDMCLSSEDGDVLKMVIASLKPFEIATKTISSVNSTTISTALPLIKGLLKMMNTVTSGKEPLSSKLKEGLNESFGKIEDIDWVVAATVLDPRFKKFPYTEREVIEKATQIIASEIASICQSQPTVTTDSSSSDPKPEMDSLWMYLDGVSMATPGQEDRTEEEPQSLASLELQRYLDSPPIPRDENPLLYWKQHQELFPTLSKLAVKYMAVPITSIPCERLFSKAGESLGEKRSKLKAKNINMILFLNCNAKLFET